MQPQRVKYLAPKVKITIGDLETSEPLYELTDTVKKYHVWTSRINPADTCEFIVSDFFDELKTGLAENMPLSISWGYRGYDFEEIFTGLVSHFQEVDKKLIKIRGINYMKHLFDAKITKTYQDERPTTIIINLIDGLGLGLDTSGVEEILPLLDKLPLYENNIAEAINIINRRMKLDYDFWFDISGILHWGPLVIPDESVFSFAYGENAIDIQPQSNQTLELLSIGHTLRPRERATVKQRSGDEGDYFIESAHYYQNEGKGSRTALDLRRIA